jgi:hypothetical protein
MEAFPSKEPKGFHSSFTKLFNRQNHMKNEKPSDSRNLGNQDDDTLAMSSNKLQDQNNIVVELP